MTTNALYITIIIEWEEFVKENLKQEGADWKMTKLIAFDLDGTLTQHKTPLSQENRKILDRLRKKYALVMVGAGRCARIFSQMEGYPIDIIGNYGLEYAIYDTDAQTLTTVRNLVFDCDRESVTKKITELRKRLGFTEYAGESVEFHASGCVTFPLLGTAAKQEDKLAFDPDRAKRRAVYNEVKAAFPEYKVFIGGTSSFDMAPTPFDKYYALDLYCNENNYLHNEVVFVGDDFGLGGNDESVYLSDFKFIKVTDYKKLEFFLKDIL